MFLLIGECEKMINSKRGLGGGFQSSDTDEVFDDIPYTVRDEYAWGRPKKGLNIDFLFRGLNKGKTRLYTFIVQMLTGMTVDAVRAAGGVPNVNADYVSKLIPFKDDPAHLYGTPDMIANDGLLFTLLAKPYGTGANDTSWRFSDISKVVANSVAPDSNTFFGKLENTLRVEILKFLSSKLTEINDIKKIKEQYNDLLRRARYYPDILTDKRGRLEGHGVYRNYSEFLGVEMSETSLSRLNTKLKEKLVTVRALAHAENGEDSGKRFIALSEINNYHTTEIQYGGPENRGRKQKGEAYFRSRMIDVSDVTDTPVSNTTGGIAIASYYSNVSAVLNSYVEYMATKMTVYDDGRSIFDGKQSSNENIVTRMNNTFLTDGKRYRIVFFEDETQASAKEYPSIQKDGTVSDRKVLAPSQLYFPRYKQRDVNAQNTYQTFNDDLDPHLALDELHITELTAINFNSFGKAPSIKIFTHNENNQPRAKLSKLSLVNFKSNYISDLSFSKFNGTGEYIVNKLIKNNGIEETREVVFDISSINNDTPTIGLFRDAENPGPIVESVEWWDNPVGYLFKNYPLVGKPTSNIPVFSRYIYNVTDQWSMAIAFQPTNYNRLFLQREIFNGNKLTYTRAAGLYREKWGVTGQVYNEGGNDTLYGHLKYSRFLVPNTSRYNELYVGNNYSDILRGYISKEFIDKYNDGRLHFEWLIYPNTVKDENNRTRPMVVNFYPIDLSKALVVSRHCEKNYESMKTSERNNLILDGIKHLSYSQGIGKYASNATDFTTKLPSFYTSFSHRRHSEFLDSIIPLSADFPRDENNKHKTIKSYLNRYFMHNPERFYQINSNVTTFYANNYIGWMLDINRIAAVKTKANIEINVNETLSLNDKTEDNLETFREVDSYIHHITNNESIIDYRTSNRKAVNYIEDEKRVLQVNMPVYTSNEESIINSTFMSSAGYNQVNYLGDGGAFEGPRSRLSGNDEDLFSPSLTIKVDDTKVMPFFDMTNISTVDLGQNKHAYIRRRYIPHYGYGITKINTADYESFKKMVDIFNNPEYTGNIPIVASNIFMFDATAYKKVTYDLIKETNRAISFIDFKILDKSGNPYKPYNFDLKDDMRVVWDYFYGNNGKRTNSDPDGIYDGNRIKLAPNFVDITISPEDYKREVAAYLEEIFNNPNVDRVGSEWDTAYSEARRMLLIDHYPRFYNRDDLAAGEIENTSYPVNLPTFTVYSRSFVPGISVTYNSPYLKRIFLRTATFPDLYTDYIDPRLGPKTAAKLRGLDTFYDRRIYHSESGRIVLNYGQPIDKNKYTSRQGSGELMETFSYAAEYREDARLNELDNEYVNERSGLINLLQSDNTVLDFTSGDHYKERMNTAERSLPKRPVVRIPAVDWTRIFYDKHGVMRREFFDVLDDACNHDTYAVNSMPYTSFNLLRFPDVDCTEFNGDIRYQNGLYGSHLGIISSVGDSVQFVVICVDDDYMFDNTGTYCLSDTLDPKTNRNKREEIIYHMLFRYAPSLEFVVFCKRQHFDQIDQNRALTAADIERMNLPDVVTLDSFRRCFSGVKNRAEFKMFGVKATRKGYDQNKALATNKQLKAKLNIR